MMQFRSPPPSPQARRRTTGPGATAAGASLATIHADALYRPVPPVACDDDGYPHDDNAPVENDYHDRLRAYLGSAMRTRYRDQDDVYAAADLGLYFEEGNRAAVVVPDLMVVLGAAPHHRLSYKLWEEPKVPDFVAEVLSESTWRRDLTVKPPLYRDLGVGEFWILDVIDKLPEPVVGMRLNASGAYEPIPPASDGALVSEVLGLELLDNDRNFRFRDLETGEIIPDHAEAVEASKAAEARALAAEAKARAARERVAQLEEELRHARGR